MQTQDHKNKETKDGNILEFTTRGGFECRLDLKAFYDVRFLDAIVTMEDNSVKDEVRGVAMMRALRFLFGEEQKDAFYQHIADQNDGYAGIEDVSEELLDIIHYVGKDKKK